jgi:hydroxymethylbilane synthase
VIRLGTRGSALALAQAGLVAGALRERGAAVEVVPIRTEGDRLAGAHLAAVGGKGLFVRELEQALLEGRIDVAVHSLKDLPAILPEGLCLGAFPERGDPRDVLVSRDGRSLDRLAPGAVVGTSSLRRRALVLARREDLRVEPIRGNVDTRLRKLAAGECDALVLAAAGLERLGQAPANMFPLDAEVFLPAAGQGILAVERRSGDLATRALLEAVDHPVTRACALAERAFLRRLGAACTTATAAHAICDGTGLSMQGLVASDDGRRVLRATAAGPAAAAGKLGETVAEELLEQGAADVAPLEPRRWDA